MTPTPLGEGKTTTSVGLTQGLVARGAKAVVTLRQPSMGPTFGIKGGAAGGGYSQVVPMERLNLHLTGDFHAVTAAHNLLAAAVDNELHHQGPTGLDPRNVTWRRVLDVNDRALRNVVIGLGARMDGVTRETGFDITAASEVMVILTLSTSLQDLRQRLGRIVVGSTSAGQPVTAEDLKVAGAMAVILKDALKPNLLQTLEGGPALIHCGPFGNIATGTSSVIADRIALAHADIVVTEAGFGADMGAERLFDVKCRVGGLRPDLAVVVTTVRAMKAHSGRFDVRPGKGLPPEMLEDNPTDVEAGLPNLEAHIEIVRRFGVTPVVAINAFPDDHRSEHEVIEKLCARLGVRCAVARHAAEGGAGAAELADVVLEELENESDFRFLYDLSASLVEKIETVGDPDLRRGRHRPRPERGPGPGRVRTARVRQPAGRHRQDPPVAELRPEAARGPQGLAAAGARGAGRGRSGLRLRDLRRHPDHARAARAPQRHACRPRRRRQRGRALLTEPLTGSQVRP